MKVLFSGIDVSKWQGEINWTAVKKSGKVDFAMVKCGHGRESPTQIDKQFERNYSEAKKAGIPVGAYHYSYALSPADAVKEAKFCYKLIKDKQFEFPIFYDVEEQSQLKLNSATLQSIIKAFCDYMETRGIWVGVYSCDSAFAKFGTDIQKRYACWSASTSYAPKDCKNYGMWQYSWKGSIPGINGDVDMDYCYIDYPSLIKKNSKNGFSAKADPVKEKTYTIPKNITFKTDVNKNVITTYSYKSHGNIFLSDHFQVKEFTSKSGNKLYSDTVKVHNKLIIILESLFAELNCSKMIVSSGYRTASHDKAVGGNGSGQHTLGRAADIVCYDKSGKIIDAKKVCCTLEDMGGIYGIGYISKNAVHVDTRSKSSQWHGDETKSGSPDISKLGYSSFHDYFLI